MQRATNLATHRPQMVSLKKLWKASVFKYGCYELREWALPFYNDFYFKTCFLFSRGMTRMSITSTGPDSANHGERE